MRRTYSHIDLNERRRIGRLRSTGVTVDVIAEKLGRHRSTIFPELERNLLHDVELPDLNGYCRVTANDMANNAGANAAPASKHSDICGPRRTIHDAHKVGERAKHQPLH